MRSDALAAPASAGTVSYQAGSLVLPYVAVVMANVSDTKSDAFELRDGSLHERELPPGANSG